VQKRSVSCASFGRLGAKSCHAQGDEYSKIIYSRYIGRNSLVLGVRNYSQETGDSNAGMSLSCN